MEDDKAGAIVKKVNPNAFFWSILWKTSPEAKNSVPSLIVGQHPGKLGRGFYTLNRRWDMECHELNLTIVVFWMESPKKAFSRPDQKFLRTVLRDGEGRHLEFDPHPDHPFHLFEFKIWLDVLGQLPVPFSEARDDMGVPDRVPGFIAKYRGRNPKPEGFVVFTETVVARFTCPNGNQIVWLRLGKKAFRGDVIVRKVVWRAAVEAGRWHFTGCSRLRLPQPRKRDA